MASPAAATFLASLRAVGTAATMAFAGFYLHRRDLVTPSGKKMMALLSQQVTIPAYLFAKIIYCPNGGEGSSEVVELGPDGEPEPVCPSVADRISDLWMLLLWPGFVVLSGLLTGYLAARLSKTPPSQISSCLAACAFGNSTGLPITLLTVIHKQFKKTTELGRLDPTAFLSVYLLLYPVLQWGVGGWLLAPEEKVEDGNKEDKSSAFDKMEGGAMKDARNGVAEAIPLLSHPSFQETQNQASAGHGHYLSLHISHLLNHEASQSAAAAAGQEEFGGVRPRHFVLRNNGDGSVCATGYIDSSKDLARIVEATSCSSFAQFGHFGSQEDFLIATSRGVSPSASVGSTLSPHAESEVEKDDEAPLTMDSEGTPLTMDSEGEASAALDSFIAGVNGSAIPKDVPFPNGDAPKDARNDYNALPRPPLPRPPARQKSQSTQEADKLSLTETLLRIARKVFQPPVIGALLGLLVASFPDLRGVLENISGDETRTAPLKWLFDGIYAVGKAAVPINMTILGINLSSTFQKKKSKKGGGKGEKGKLLSNKTMMAVVIGKMFVMPAIGIASTWFLQKYYINLPDEIDATCYLVMMIVFITPTANNVMVMVELSGSSSKEGMARLIGWQYAVSPVVLSVVLSAVVTLASGEFGKFASVGSTFK